MEIRENETRELRALLKKIEKTAVDLSTLNYIRRIRLIINKMEKRNKDSK